jgi:hypothetical protein
MTESLLQRIEANESILLVIGRRLGALEAFLAELDRVTRGKPFHVWNGLQWLLLLDSRDILVVHLASWAKSVYEPGGLLGQIGANHLRDLSRKLIPTERDLADAHFMRLRSKFREEAFARLFPNATDAHPKPPDVDGLRDSFSAKMKPVLEDRHANRAHPFERKKGSAAMLELSQMRELYDYSTKMMNDLRLVGCDSTFGYPEGSWDKGAAIDLVDALLIGTSSRMRIVRGETPRDEYYARLHERHDALADPSAAMFNDVRRDGEQSGADEGGEGGDGE